MQQKIEH